MSPDKIDLEVQRALFEEHIFALYFIKGVKRNTEPSRLPIGMPFVAAHDLTMAELMKKAEDGLYEREEIEAMWVAWQEAARHLAPAAYRQGLEDAAKRVEHRGALAWEQDQPKITEAMHFAAKDLRAMEVPMGYFSPDSHIRQLKGLIEAQRRDRVPAATTDPRPDPGSAPIRRPLRG